MSCSTTATGPKRTMPPTYFFAALAAAVASRFVFPFWARATVLTIGLGVALLAAGVTLNLLADSAFKKRRTPVSPDAEPSAFVTSGVFRLTRNPMYLGMALIVAGAALLVGEPIALLSAAVLVWILDRYFVGGEERKLDAAFGGGYAAYKAAVRRWI